MSTLEEVGDATDVLYGAGLNRNQLILLHCTSEYPAPFDTVNLNAMLTMRDHFKVRVGYSDHTNGILISMAAVALGAVVIEKHFTLDKDMEGPDHKASLSPSELSDLIRGIREIERAIGDGIKSPTLSEIENAKVARKSLVASKYIAAGDIFSEDNLTVKRPGTGISPMKINQIFGTLSPRSFAVDELIVL
jgi:N,N'-diacetyllegionaminate synthase